MSVFEKTVEVLCGWAGITSDQIASLQTELCVLLAIGRPGVACDADVLAPLVADLKGAFPDKDLSGLRPSDLKSPGKIRTVDSLADFIAKSANVGAAEAAKKAGAGKKPAAKNAAGAKKTAKSSKKAAGKISAKKSGKGKHK